VTETPLRFCSYFTTQCLGQRDGEGAARRREECREETGRRAERAGTQEGKAAASPFYANYSSFHDSSVTASALIMMNVCARADLMET
jgi:hypothetical protein